MRAESGANEGQSWNLFLDIVTYGLVGVFLIAILIRVVIALKNRRARDLKSSVIGPIFASSAVESTLFGFEPGADRSLSTQLPETAAGTEAASTSEAAGDSGDETGATEDRRQL